MEAKYLYSLLSFINLKLKDEIYKKILLESHKKMYVQLPLYDLQYNKLYDKVICH